MVRLEAQVLRHHGRVPGEVAGGGDGLSSRRFHWGDYRGRGGGSAADWTGGRASWICFCDAACKRLASAGRKPSSRKRLAPGLVTWRMAVSVFIDEFFHVDPVHPFRLMRPHHGLMSFYAQKPDATVAASTSISPASPALKSLRANPA